VTIVSERAFQDQVVTLAHLFGWTVAHFRPARTARGWRTPVAADGAGFPDLVLVKEGRLICAELKSQRGKLSAAQEMWLALLSTVPGVLAVVWKPADWDVIASELQRGE